MKTTDIVIETPKGSAEKYSYDKKSGYFRLKKILAEGMVFPFDFGFIPGTKGEDGDPLDALVISEFRSFPGCLVECRLIGGLIAEQTKNGKWIRNDRFFFIPLMSKQFGSIETIKDLPEQIREELKNFFIGYNAAEGREFRIIDIAGPEKSGMLIGIYPN